MKHLIFLFTALSICILSIACNSDTNQESPTDKVEVQKVAPAPAPINNDLTDAQLEDIKTIHASFSEVYPISLNESIKNFKRDQDPSREIEIWMKMVQTFESLTSDKEYQGFEKKQEVFSVILASTMMPVEAIKTNVELTELNKQDVDYIVAKFLNSFK